MLSNSLSKLKLEQDYSSKLYLGISWKLPNLFELNKYYNNGNGSFNIGGLTITNIDNTTPSPFHTVDLPLQVSDLIISCTVGSDATVIHFGNDKNQTTLGKLLYYPLNTTINITYRTVNEYTDKTKTITLNKTYSDVGINLDSFKSGSPLRTTIKQIS